MKRRSLIFAPFAALFAAACGGSSKDASPVGTSIAVPSSPTPAEPGNAASAITGALPTYHWVHATH